MSSLIDRIRARRIVAFYLLAYLISWVLWLPGILLRVDLLEILAAIGLFGPALACVLLARSEGSEGRGAAGRRYWVVFLLSWALATLILTGNSRASSGGASPVFIVVAAVLALVPAYVTGRAATLEYGALSSLLRPRGDWAWYLLAIGLPPATRLASVALSREFGWVLLSRPQLPGGALELAGSILIASLYTLVFAGGLNEELGWTGYDLPRLLARLNPLLAALVVWAFWILWHLPLSLAGLQDLGPHVLIGTFFGRFIFTWLFLRSSGGLLTAVLFHTSANVASQIVPITNANLWIEGLLGMILLVGARMWQKLPADHPAVQPLSRLPA